MSTATAEQVLVVLNVPPSLEEPLIDWLLGLEQTVGFTSSSVSGHSARHEGLTAAEQVSGRQRRMQFQVQMGVGQVNEFLTAVNESFGKADVHYWVLPVIAGGRLGQLQEEEL